MKIEFTLNTTRYESNNSQTYFYATENVGTDKLMIKRRISKAEFEKAYDQFEKEQFMTKFDDAAENDGVTLEEFCQLVQDAEPVNYCRHPEGTDLQVPAVIDPQYGCVDCSKCNVQNCVHRNCMRRNPVSYGGLAECPRLKVKAEEPKTEQPKAKKERKPRKSKNAFHTSIAVPGLTLTEKQVSFILHLSDTCFWENGLDSTIWVDCLCDDIQGQFAGKPMTVGAMISTLCEKGLGTRVTCRREKRKCTSFELTELGKLVAVELGLH